MRSSIPALAIALVGVATAASITDICTTASVESALPANGTFNGINFVTSHTTASIVYNASSATGGMGGGPSGSTTSTSTVGYPYCNVTITYARTGKTDVVLKYAFPNPSDFESRFYVAGGGGYSLSSDPTGGLKYGAAGGVTNGGYDAFNYDLMSKALYGNGSINWDAIYMFSYEGLGEMTEVGKYITGKLYSSDKVYTYYEGCSDGGREGMSQVQRYGEIYDGVIAGAPAFRFAQQQVHHVFPAVVEQTLNYYPPPCELAKIVNETIAACDPLDGRTDGVISRTDLCKLKFDLKSIIGKSYYCAAQTSSSLGFGFSKRQALGSQTSSAPAQNGTVSMEGVAVAQAIYDGLHNSQGERAYLSWQIGSELSDADTTYDNTTGGWKVNVPSTGGEYVTRFIELNELDNLPDINGVTYDTLVSWMRTGYYRYLDSLQTTVPDLTPFQASGGKLLHYHGESDPSVPAASSVHYWQAVGDVMHRNSTSDMASWYQFYLVPGAAHCGTNSLQPGPYPQNNMDTMIDWVENGVEPKRLNATVSSGTNKGETQMLCQWPSRPLWRNGTSSFDCVRDRASENSWTYSFPAFKVPIY